VRPSERGFLAFVVREGKARERVVELGLRTADGLDLAAWYVPAAVAEHQHAASSGKRWTLPLATSTCW